MHVFRWNPRIYHPKKSGDLPPYTIPFTQNSWMLKVKDPISGYVDHPENAGPSLRPLLEFAEQILISEDVDSSDFHNFPIFFKATGGLRLLNDTAREAILDSVRIELHESGFEFDWTQARCISGEEEAVFGWVTVNLLFGELLTAGEGGTATATPNSTVGSLDMGGASTQIAFFRPEQDILSNLYKLQIGMKKHYNVYVHSFLHFGHDSALERLNSNFDPPLVNPCTPPANFSECEKAATVLLHKDSNKWCMYSHGGQCSYAGVYQPPLVGKFVAMSAFAATYTYLGLDNSSDLSALRDAATVLCESSPPASAAKAENEAYYCFLSTYLFTMLYRGYGFSLDNTPIIAIAQYEGRDIDYTLGGMLFEINDRPYKLVLDKSYTISAVVAAVCAVVVFEGLAVCYRFRGRISRMLRRDHGGGSGLGEGLIDRSPAPGDTAGEYGAIQ
jgi:hypothetical protein